jgi:hypothetical protein
MTFSTSLDDTAKKRTAAAFILFSCATLGYSSIFKNWVVSLSFFVVFMAFLGIAYLIKPISYEVTKTTVVIRRLIGKILINRLDIVRIEKIYKDLLQNSRTGGGFGYFGKLDTPMGKMTWYGTRRNNLVVLTMKDQKRIVLTPDEWDGFIQKLEE